MNRKQRESNRRNADHLRRVKRTFMIADVRRAASYGPMVLTDEHRAHGIRECANCGEILMGDGHFAPPSAGFVGRYVCDGNRLNHSKENHEH